jgi:hypothetical protein
MDTDLRSTNDGPLYVSLDVVAARSGLSRWTLYHWIADGKLTATHGLTRAGRKHLVKWAVFVQAFARGDFAS